MEARMQKKLTMLMAVAVVVAALVAQPVSAQEDRQSGEGPVRTEQSGKQENCDPGPVAGEYVCITGAFSGTFVVPDYSGTRCALTDFTVDWGDGSGEEALPVASPHEVVVPHQYVKRGIYTVEVTNVVDCGNGESTGVNVYLTVEVPGAQKCEQGSSRMATASSEYGEEDACSDENCAVSMGLFCLVDSELKKAKTKVKKLKKELDKIKAINDPEERAKQVRKIEYELRSARQEYENQVKQAEKEATENAQKFEASKDYVLKEFNGALKGK